MIDDKCARSWDLVTPDGVLLEPLEEIKSKASCPPKPGLFKAKVHIEGISSSFLGFELPPSTLHFNLRSVLGQIGLHSLPAEIELSRGNKEARVTCIVACYGAHAKKLAQLLSKGAHMGKIFCLDPRRLVREPYYLERMMGRFDRKGRPLLAFGGKAGTSEREGKHCDALLLEKEPHRARTLAWIPVHLQPIVYDEEFDGFLPTLARSLSTSLSLRQMIRLHQRFSTKERIATMDEILLLRTDPLHIRTVFGRVAHDLLPSGVEHTSADILDPSTDASGDIYELFASKDACQKNLEPIDKIPLEFYTLEPEREHVFFEDRDQLQAHLESPEALFDVFKSCSQEQHIRAAVYVVKGTQMKSLTPSCWVERTRPLHNIELDEGSIKTRHGSSRALQVRGFIASQPEYPFLKALDEELITSEGALFSKYFPTPLIKRLALSPHVQRKLKRLYFSQPSQRSGDFFSHEDHNFLIDLWSFGIGVFWVDQHTERVLQYAKKPHHHGGIFVPVDRVELYMRSSVFGVYGSNLLHGQIEQELDQLVGGILELRKETDHPMLRPTTPLAFVTGGGPGAMEVGNRVAKKHDILSCAHIVDFSQHGQKINEQVQNSYIEAKMTYRLTKLIERQADFNLDFPIFVMGGIGTDFEYALEEVRRKTGSSQPYPVILLGSREYWWDKITPRFTRNLQSGTIEGSQWVSNTFFRVDCAKEALEVYRRFFKGQLPLGPKSPWSKEGFIDANSSLFRPAPKEMP